MNEKDLISQFTDAFPLYGSCLLSHSCHEPVHIDIIWANIPTEKQIADIIAIAPIPLALRKENFNNYLLSISLSIGDSTEDENDKGYLIEDIYEKHNEKNDDLYFYGYCCGRGALNAFENEIIKWLLFVNKEICPLIVGLCYDNKLCDRYTKYWHNQKSMELIPSVLLNLNNRLPISAYEKIQDALIHFGESPTDY